MEAVTKEEIVRDIREKVIKGLILSAQRLVEARASTDGELIFFEDGKIVRVKARRLLAERKRAKGSEQAQHE